MLLKNIVRKKSLWRKKPALRSTDAFIAAINTYNFIAGCKNVLIVGAHGLRDVTFLKEMGKSVTVLDIAQNKQISDDTRVVIQSIEDRTPFKNGEFDAIVMNEVVEHLFFDVNALLEVNRILSNNGALVVTVPYFHDKPEHHVRIHSRKTIFRLLKRCGFGVEKHFYRGFSSNIVRYLVPRALIYIMIKMVQVIGGKNSYESTKIINGPLNSLEIFLGSSKYTIWFQKKFRTYGGIMKVKKVPHSDSEDFNLIQKEDFKQ